MVKKSANKTSAKPAAGKKAAKKPAAKKSAAKGAAKKKPVKKAAAKTAPQKKPTKKAASKKPASKKPAPKKTVTKKVDAKKAGSKKVVSKKTAPKQAMVTIAGTPKFLPRKKVAKKVAKVSATGKPGEDASKGNRKGITIVSNKPARRTRPARPVLIMPVMPKLLGPGSPKRKPLIASGPKAAPKNPKEDSGDAKGSRKRKSPFNKRQLDKFKAILLAKRTELFGDMSRMEQGALQNDGSSQPQHDAEQGSDSYDQTLSLNLAAADRALIKEIDAALQRIAERSYGLCEMTGKPISEARLAELPWARYSIDAAREMERRGGQP